MHHTTFHWRQHWTIFKMLVEDTVTALKISQNTSMLWANSFHIVLKCVWWQLQPSNTFLNISHPISCHYCICICFFFVYLILVEQAKSNEKNKGLVQPHCKAFLVLFQWMSKGHLYFWCRSIESYEGTCFQGHVTSMCCMYVSVLKIWDKHTLFKIVAFSNDSKMWPI